MRWERLNVYMVILDDGDETSIPETLCECSLSNERHYHIEGKSKKVLALRVTAYLGVVPGLPVPAGQLSLWRDPKCPDSAVDEFAIGPRPPL